MTDNQQMAQQLNSTEQQHFVQTVYAEVAQMIKNGQSAFRIQQSLVERGLKLEDAREIVSQLQDAQNKTHRSQATKQMTIGAILCLIGLILAVAIYVSTSPLSFYTIAVITVLFGLWRFRHGVSMISANPS